MKTQYSLIILGMVALSMACNDANEPTPNTAPTAWIVSGPREGSTTHYKPQIHWDGFDKDGVIDHFQYAITSHVNGTDPGVASGGWTNITTHTEVFFVAADLVADPFAFDDEVLMPLEASRGHSFYIRSIDNEGAVSKPDTRNFTSRNVSPVVDLTQPSTVGTDSVVVSPLLTFRWTGIDYIQSLDDETDPIESRWILIGVDSMGGTWSAALEYARNNADAPEWSDWMQYDIVRSFTTPDSLSAGNHIFAVQVRDEAGAVSESIDLLRNARKLVVE